MAKKDRRLVSDLTTTLAKKVRNLSHVLGNFCVQVIVRQLFRHNEDNSERTR